MKIKIIYKCKKRAKQLIKDFDTLESAEDYCKKEKIEWLDLLIVDPSNWLKT